MADNSVSYAAFLFNEREGGTEIELFLKGFVMPSWILFNDQINSTTPAFREVKLRFGMCLRQVCYSRHEDNFLLLVSFHPINLAHFQVPLPLSLLPFSVLFSLSFSDSPADSFAPPAHRQSQATWAAPRISPLVTIPRVVSPGKYHNKNKTLVSLSTSIAFTSSP